jgi:hypothetical protein
VQVVSRFTLQAMEGVGTKVSRSVAGRTAVALLAAGGLLVGLSACGSDSKQSTSAKPSTTGAKKQAVGKGVRLDIVNRSRNALAVTICGDGSCRAEQPLNPGESTTMASGSVNGRFAFAGGGEVRFTADNPVVGRPSIGLRTSSDSVDFPLSEGESRTARLSSFAGVLTGSRAYDTDYKMLRLEVAQ